MQKLSKIEQWRAVTKEKHQWPTKAETLRWTLDANVTRCKRRTLLERRHFVGHKSKIYTCVLTWYVARNFVGVNCIIL